MLVTTSADPGERVRHLAKRVASELGAPFVERRGRSIRELGEAQGCAGIVVVGEDGIRCYGRGKKPFFFHPGMAAVRVKRLMNGERDPMLEAAGAGAGDRVVDCTMGLGSDAIVFAHAVGPSGKVTAVESEPLLHLVVSHGLAAHEPGDEALREAMRRVETVCADHLEYLKTLEDRSVDIVYFDPMFREPAAGPAMEPLRELANPAAIRPEAVREARRVARKAVVLKEKAGSAEFERLGFTPVRRSAGKFAYGVIRP